MVMLPLFPLASGRKYFLRDNFALEVGPSFYRSLSANRDFSRLALNVGGQFFLGR